MKTARMVCLALLCLVVSAPSSGAALLGRSQVVYAVSAHPDDEPGAWTQFEHRPDTYFVFVLMTRGERTTSCMTPEESVPPTGGDVGSLTMIEGFVEPDPLRDEGIDPGGDKYHGPYKYQGPGSPVAQPDTGERHPLGFPWQGRGSQACADARVASWHWFLDGMAELDPSLANMNVEEDPAFDDDYRGTFCDPTAGCARVWANPDGARVAFDFGDGNLTPDEVVAGVRHLRESRAGWGISMLPEAGVIAAAYFYDGSNPACFYYDHRDHGAVQTALYSTDVGAGPQWGPACVADPRVQESPGPVGVNDPAVLVGMNYVDPLTEERVGPYNVNYGWLFQTYQFIGEIAGAYWKRFG